MNLLSIIAGGIKLINLLIELAERRRLIDQGIAKASHAQLEGLADVIKDAQELRRNLSDADRERLREKYKRH